MDGFEKGFFKRKGFFFLHLRILRDIVVYIHLLRRRLW